MDVDQTLSTDITTDSAWNIYEREFNSACDDDINGGNGGGGGIQGQGGFWFSKNHNIYPFSNMTMNL